MTLQSLISLERFCLYICLSVITIAFVMLLALGGIIYLEHTEKHEKEIAIQRIVEKQLREPISAYRDSWYYAHFQPTN